MRKLIYCLVLLLAPLASMAGTLLHRTAPSALLSGMPQVDYTIYLPDSMTAGRKFPIAYLLHGGGCSNTEWQDHGHLEEVMDSLIRRGEVAPMIVVCPEANKKNMIWFNDPLWRYEDFFFTEFMPYIEHTYPVIADRRYRFVGGFSMGGGGAVVYGIHHPELFSMVYDMSGYLRRQPLDFLKNDPQGEWRQQVVERNNPILVVSRASADQVNRWKQVSWFVDCGDHDFTLEGNMDFVKALRKQGIDYQMRVHSGAHNWDYWAPCLVNALKQFSLRAYHANRLQVVEQGGMGKYPSVMLSVDGFKAHTVFCPQDLSAFDASHPLPVVVWGNGACTDSPWEHYRFLNEIASHGYLVIATGYFPNGDTPYQGPMSSPQQQIESIDWAVKQVADSNSVFYGKIDTRAICASGMSCGGLQTLYNCGDPRIKTYMICNSGLFIDPSIAMPNMPMPHKEQLLKVHGPIIYILGGKEDIAYNNGMDDFRRITHVPAVAVNYPVGHGGTYRQPHGGEFRIPAVAWLDWQLKGDRQAAKMFIGKNCGLVQRKGWTIERNKKMKANL